MKKDKYLVGLFLIASICALCFVKSKYDQNKYALFNAAQVDDLGKVELLVKQGVPIDQRVPKVFGFTPLIGAIYHDSTNTACFLIESGADVNLSDEHGVTPLMWATSLGDKAVPLAELLITHGASLDAKDNSGITVLGYAQSDPPKPQLVKLFEATKQNELNEPTNLTNHANVEKTLNLNSTSPP